jgi:hypothetical protein
MKRKLRTQEFKGLSIEQIEHFELMVDAMDNESLVLVECRDRETGELQAIICACMETEHGTAYLPMAILCSKDAAKHYEPNDLGASVQGSDTMH